MSYRMTKTHEKRHLMGAPSDSAKGRRYQVTSDTALSFRLAHEAVVFLGQEKWYNNGWFQAISNDTADMPPWIPKEVISKSATEAVRLEDQISTPRYL